VVQCIAEFLLDVRNFVAIVKLIERVIILLLVKVLIANARKDIVMRVFETSQPIAISKC
jgi:hypothetical protein